MNRLLEWLNSPFFLAGEPPRRRNAPLLCQDTGAPVLEGSRGSEVVTVTTPLEEGMAMDTVGAMMGALGEVILRKNGDSMVPTRWYPPVVSWFIIPINYRYNPRKP